jgi:hypothetical protein
MAKLKIIPECNYLRQVTVRLLRPEERERFDARLEAEPVPGDLLPGVWF